MEDAGAADMISDICDYNGGLVMWSLFTAAVVGSCIKVCITEKTNVGDAEEKKPAAMQVVFAKLQAATALCDKAPFGEEGPGITDALSNVQDEVVVTDDADK